MKALKYVILAGIVVTGCRTASSESEAQSLRPQPQPPVNNSAWVTLSDYAAQDLFDAMHVRAVRGLKKIAGKGTISCTVQASSIPDGAQGIAAPSASCAGYPHVDWPVGVQGIVAPWFNLSGLSGYALYDAMDVAVSERTKSKTGEYTIECQENRRGTTCKIDVVETEEPADEALFSVTGDTAVAIHDQLAIYDNNDDDIREVSGEGTISCHGEVSALPPGAQGIAAPSASCAGYPRVEFPAGTQGIVAPWFTLRGYQGFGLFSAMPGEQDENRNKSLTGDISIKCSLETTFGNRTSAKCDFFQN